MASDMKNQMLLPKEVNTTYAQVVYQMMVMGYFDTELTMYGTAYLDQNDERRYVVSANEDHIYRFHDEAPFLGYAPSPIKEFTEKCKVPAGYEEDIANQVKYRLAQHLQEQYPKSLLQQYKDIQEADVTDKAFDILEAYRREIELLFNEDYLNILSGLVNLCYRKKLLSPKGYKYFCNWIDYTLKQMEEDLVFNDIFQKTFYTFAYQHKSGKVKYYTNAQHHSTYRSLLQAEQRGENPSPIFGKRWQYNYKYRLADAKRDHIELAKKLLDVSYMKKIADIYALESALKPQQILTLNENVQNKGTEAARKMYEYYFMRWNLA